MDFETKNLAALDLDSIFGDENCNPLNWAKFRLFCSKMAADINFALGTTPQVLDMADAAHGLVASDPGAGETIVTSSVLIVDPNSAGASEILTFNQAELPVGKYHIINSGGEGIVVKNTGADTIATIATAKSAIIFNDGTNLYASLSA